MRPAMPAMPAVRARALAIAVVFVSAAHLALLAAWHGEALPPALTTQRLAAVTVDVRQIRWPAAPAVDAAATTTPVAPASPPVATRALENESGRLVAARDASQPQRLSERLSQPSAAASAHATPAAVPSVRLDPAETPEPADPFEAARPTPDAAVAATAPPTYRTQLPPSMTLHYEVRRGDISGQAQLDWQLRADGRYEIELRAAGNKPSNKPGNHAGARPTAAVPAALAPHWTSRGTLDAAGIAPERFAVSRRGRERHAANFQREPGIVTFAGPARTWPLVDGAQDRLSWMLQLAAVLQAEPALAAAGASISMMVVGAHGDAGIWTFAVLGPEVIADAQGEPIATVALQRESRHAHDPQVQVWLAPDRHHVPARLRLTMPRTGESTEFLLRALQPEPR